MNGILYHINIFFFQILCVSLDSRARYFQLTQARTLKSELLDTLPAFLLLYKAINKTCKTRFSTHDLLTIVLSQNHNGGYTGKQNVF
jgi:hypothetical protein